MKIPAIFTNASDPTPELSDEIGGSRSSSRPGSSSSCISRRDRSGAVIILEAQSAEDAQRQPATLPPRSWA